MKSQRILAWGTILFFLMVIPTLGQVKAKARVKPQPQPVIELPLPMGGVAEGPETAVDKKDLSMHGPGGSRFVYLEDKNQEPMEAAAVAIAHIPGPGEPGFVCDEQANLYPGESTPRNRPAPKDPAVKGNKPKK